MRRLLNRRRYLPSYSVFWMRCLTRRVLNCNETGARIMDALDSWNHRSKAAAME